ncbi:MAG: M12 family metallo-peptidase [Verrucomicrobia bacterium]|nr:M12 family metallo-peptidase [Verrucomicrobiota bacterium]
MKTKLTIGFLLVAAFFAPLGAQVVALPYQLVVNPIFVQNGPAGNIAVQSNYASSIALFQEATQRVYAQAGIRVVWQAPTVFTTNNSSFYTIGFGPQGSLDVDNLTQASGNGASGSATILNLWFTGPTPTGTLGVSQQSNNLHSFSLPDGDIKHGATVSESIFVPSGSYSLTTLPHEIGHVLGLDHNAIISGQGGPAFNQGLGTSSTVLTGGNLMAGGTVGATTLGAITTDGSTGFGLLTANQITMLHLSPMVTTNPVAGDTYNYSAIPEPASYALAVGSLIAFSMVVRRRRN